MKFVIAWFCSVAKVTHLLHVNNTHETKVYKRIFTLPCFNKLKQKNKTKQNKNRNKKVNKQTTTRKNLNI